MIEVKGLSKKYSVAQGDHVVFSNVSCSIRKGDVIGVIGPSGCGKSTFIQCLMTLEQASSGEIWYNGENICAPGVNLNRVRSRMGMVFQDFNLFEHLTVMENIILAPIKIDGLSSAEARAQAMELLRLVGLAECADQYPDQLSGGQKQRAAIARCLAMKPDVIFFDEPTSALDTTKKKEVAAVIKRLAQQGMTMVIVTHEHKLVQRVCNRVFFFCQGELYEQGTLDEVFKNPCRMLTRAYVQSIFGMKYTVNSRDFDLYALNSEIELYCYNNSLAAYTGIVELLCEELLTNIMPYTGKVQVEMKLAYNNTPALTLIQEDCEGPILDREGVDDLSLALLRGYCDDITDQQNGRSRYIKLELKPLQ